jgi:hypothetical protein
MDNLETLSTLATQDIERGQTKPPPPHTQTTRGKDEPTIVFMRKSYRTLQHGTKIIEI